jgi:choline dehydrogenase-like flavoprotein
MSVPDNTPIRDRTKNAGTRPEQDALSGVFADRVRRNQEKLRSELKSSYDFIVCGSGSSGSVVARRLAENAGVSVLLLEAGGSDDVPSVREAAQWPLNLGTERDWNFVSQPELHLNGRTIPLAMGKVLGGGSSINVMTYSRGHKSDWEFFASEADDPAWNYDSVLSIYRHIEDWHGAPDPKYRGVGGPVFVQSAPDPSPIAPAWLEGARSLGIPIFENQNGRLMESAGGASYIDMRARDGKRQSVFRSYVFPYMDRSNLTVLTHALVTRIAIEDTKAIGVEVVYEGKAYSFRANCEVVLSLGAIHTPKVLMQSGIGDEAELQHFGIPVVQHLPGVGRNFQDHVALGCVWEYRVPLAPRNTASEATGFWRSHLASESPDLQITHAEVPVTTDETDAQFHTPPESWTVLGGVLRPKSRGRVLLSGPNVNDPVRITANLLTDPGDMKRALECVELCREIGNSSPLSPFRGREVMPGNLKGTGLENFVRDAASSFRHETCTAKMGRDSMSVMDSQLRVYGVRNLRVADGSIMPRVTTGNTMAPCIVIGERAGEILKNCHGL